MTLIMVYPSALNPSIKLGSIEPSLSSPVMEANVGAMLVVMAKTVKAMVMAMNQDVDVG
jgi:hypothetical protein